MPQIACLRGCIITMVAFVWLYSTMNFQVSPQIACLRGCVITLVAFVWLFTKMCFQMSLQTSNIRWCKVTLIAFFWLLSITFHFHGNLYTWSTQTFFVHHHKKWMLVLEQWSSFTEKKSWYHMIIYQADKNGKLIPEILRNLNKNLEFYHFLFGKVVP